MASYRLYCLDGAGQINLAEWIEAGNDAEALMRARQLKDGARRLEVWDGKRLVAQLGHNDFSASMLNQARR
jgi:hypothetical protein